MSLQLTDAAARKWTEAAFLRQNCKSRHQLLAEAFVRENKQRVAHWEVLPGREVSCQVLERGEVATWRKVTTVPVQKEPGAVSKSIFVQRIEIVGIKGIL